MSHGVLVALEGELEQEVVVAVDSARDLVVVRRCADVAELLAAALAGLGALAVLDAAQDVDRSLLGRLQQAGTSVVVVCEERDRQRVENLGVRAVPRASGAAAVVAALREVATTPATAPSVTAPEPELPPRPLRPGGLVIVWGPHGAPGRTTVALNLASEIAAAGQRALLVDADVWGAAIGPALGLLEETAGLAAAVRAADQGTLDHTSLRRLCARLSDTLLVLPGLSRSARWREVSGPAIDAVWECARTAADWVVVEAGTWVPEDDASAGFEAVLGPRRNAVTRSALAAADALVVVGAAEPVGIQRLVQTLLDLDERGGAPPRRQVVVTRVRVDAAGHRPADSVREALHRFAGVGDVLLVPDDRVACDKAALAGATLTEVAPRSAARAAIADLATWVTGVQAGTSRRRRRRAGSRAAAPSS